MQKQLEEMLDQRIIEESSSPWMAPAVYVRKKSGELRMCVDYRELNKQTAKDAYPLPFPDEIEDKLAHAIQNLLHPGFQEWILAIASAP